MATGDLITQKEAAAILNRSVSAVSRAIKDGRLEYADPQNRLLHRPGLEMRFRRKTRPRIDRPQRKNAKSAGEGIQPGRIATHRNGLVGAVERQAQLRAGWWPCVLAPRVESPPVDAVLLDDR